MEIVKHVIGKLVQPEFMGVSDRLLIRLPQSPVVECDAEWFQADCRKLPQIHWVFAKDPSVNALVKVHSSLNGNSARP
jgi:hypothetical protein